MDTQKAIEAILDDYEHQPLQDKRTFRAYLNQPELISLSSTNQQLQSSAISPNTNNSYFNFVVNLPRPALNAKSLQLLKAIVPQAQCSIPDYALVFPYYRLRCVPTSINGDIKYVDKPSYNNLLFIRLLPSSYKKELMKSPVNRPYNRTFNDYEELATQISKACIDDEAFNSQFISHYTPNDISITYNSDENKFKFKGLRISTEPVLNTYPEWSSSTTYSIGNIVFYGLNFYKCISTSTGGFPPPANTKFKQVYNLNTYTSWSSLQSYVIDNVVIYNSIFYICIKNTKGSDNGPPDVEPDYWLDVSKFFSATPIFNTYLIAGYEDPNVLTLLNYVKSGSTSRDCIGTSIPGNPVVENQTLSRRLGFTWDSTGMITDTINDYVTEAVLYGSTIALFYNRLIPIPNYNIRLEDPEGLDEIEAIPSEESLYYTADGYCNLVYSSVISIYTTIIGTSTVDTQRDANLIAMIDVNCGNLGIAFGNNFIDTKLTKIQSDVYSIYVELRDENGEPYYLTNNATTTLLLKLTYD